MSGGKTLKEVVRLLVWVPWVKSEVLDTCKDRLAGGRIINENNFSNNLWYFWFHVRMGKDYRVYTG